MLPQWLQLEFFLLIRSSPLLEFAPTALIVIVIIGAITAFFAATVGLVQNDIKRVIAYSTCSQLGYMVFACGISNYSTSLFHLMNHAFFKALLFLSAGCIIHAMADEQDMRKLGGLIKNLPFTYSMMLIGSLSLMGFPFLTGYYSKDAILELAYAHYTIEGTFANWLGTISAMFTAYYSIRLIYLTFITEPNSSKENFKHAHESPWRMSIPLVILAFGSIFVGYIFRDMIIGVGTSFFGNAIFNLPANTNQIEAEFIPTINKWIPVIFSMTGAIGAMLLYHFGQKEIMERLVPSYPTKNIPGLMKVYTFLNNKWHFDYIYNSYVVKPLLEWGYQVSYKQIDRGLIEMWGPEGLSKNIKKLSISLSSLQSGYIYNYAFGILVAATSMLIWISNIGVIQPELYLILPATIIIINIYPKINKNN